MSWMLVYYPFKRPIIAIFEEKIKIKCSWFTTISVLWCTFCVESHVEYLDWILQRNLLKVFSATFIHFLNYICLRFFFVMEVWMYLFNNTHVKKFGNHDQCYVNINNVRQIKLLMGRILPVMHVPSHHNYICVPIFLVYNLRRSIQVTNTLILI